MDSILDKFWLNSHVNKALSVWELDLDSHLLAMLTHARTSYPCTMGTDQGAQMMEHMRCELNGTQLQYGTLPVANTCSGLVPAFYLVPLAATAPWPTWLARLNPPGLANYYYASPRDTFLLVAVVDQTQLMAQLA